jgi:Sec-independent protein translocase protein TatA
MKSFARMALSLFALVIVLFVFALLFSPQVRTAFVSQSGETAIGQLRSDSELKTSGQAPRSSTEALTPENSARESETQSGTTSRE